MTELLKIAPKSAPNGSFVLADTLTYKYPKDMDVIYAFASLLHVNKTDLFKVFEKTSQSLKKDGVLYISLKEKLLYIEEVKKR